MVDPNYSKETFYVLDADGNVMAINERITTVTGGPLIFAINTDFKCVEQFVYGSSRLGTIHANVGLNVLNPLLNTNANSNLFDVYYGKKDYELTNHLGNVITTVSDRKKAIDGVYSYVGYGTGNYEFDGTDFVSVTAGTGYYNQTTAPNGTVDFYVADIRTVADYYAFGQAMPGRSHAVGNIKYRYGMNGQELEDEVFDGATSAEYWMYDSRLGRRFENDPIVYEEQSPYACFNNNPVYYSDPDGLEGTNGSNSSTKSDGEKNGGKDKGKGKSNPEPDPDTKNKDKGKIHYGKLFHGKIINWITIQLSRLSKNGSERYNKWKKSGEDVYIFNGGDVSIFDGGKEDTKEQGKNKHINFQYKIFSGKIIDWFGKVFGNIGKLRIKIDWPTIDWPKIKSNIKFKFGTAFQGWGWTFSWSIFGHTSWGFGNWKEYTIWGLKRIKPYTTGQIAKAHPGFTRPLIKISWINRRGHYNFIRFGRAMPNKAPLINIFKNRKKK